MVHKTAHAFGVWAMLNGVYLGVFGMALGTKTSLYLVLNGIALSRGLTYGQFWFEVIFPVFLIFTAGATFIGASNE